MPTQTVVESYYHTAERLLLIHLSGFLYRAAAHLRRHDCASKTNETEIGDQLAVRMLQAVAELVNVEALFYA